MASTEKSSNAFPGSGGRPDPAAVCHFHGAAVFPTPGSIWLITAGFDGRISLVQQMANESLGIPLAMGAGGPFRVTISGRWVCEVGGVAACMIHVTKMGAENMGLLNDRRNSLHKEPQVWKM